MRGFVISIIKYFYYKTFRCQDNQHSVTGIKSQFYFRFWLYSLWCILVLRVYLVRRFLPYVLLLLLGFLLRIHGSTLIRDYHINLLDWTDFSVLFLFRERFCLLFSMKTFHVSLMISDEFWQPCTEMVSCCNFITSSQINSFENVWNVIRCVIKNLNPSKAWKKNNSPTKQMQTYGRSITY